MHPDFPDPSRGGANHDLLPSRVGRSGKRAKLSDVTFLVPIDGINWLLTMSPYFSQRISIRNQALNQAGQKNERQMGRRDKRDLFPCRIAGSRG